MIPAVFLGIVSGPALLIKVLIVFAIEQTVEGRFISPLVLGSQLSIHPVTILVVLLTSGKLFGIVGVILGIPVYAAAKVIITHFLSGTKSFPVCMMKISQINKNLRNKETSSERTACLF